MHTVARKCHTTPPNATTQQLPGNPRVLGKFLCTWLSDEWWHLRATVDATDTRRSSKSRWSSSSFKGRKMCHSRQSAGSTMYRWQYT